MASPGSSNNSVLSKQMVEEKIECGEFILQRKKGTCAAWKKFATICDKITNEYMGFVQCMQCKAVYKMKTGSGTSHLLRHDCTSTRSRNNSQCDGVPASTIPAIIKSRITEKCVEFCGKDLRPFNVVQGQGFQALAQELLNIGAEIGRIDSASLLPHPTTISRHVSASADNLRSMFIPRVKSYLQDGYCALDTDLWTDKYTKTNYMTVTTQYISNDWEMRSNVLCTTEFPDEPKSGINVKDELEYQLSNLGIFPEELQKATFVTDQGSNIKVALQEYKRLPCIAHCLSTVLRHTLDEEKFLSTSAPLIMNSLRACKSTTNYLKRTGLCKNISISVKQMIDTRWNTLCNMVESMCQGYQEIVELLIRKGEMNRLQGWNPNLMNELVQFLSHFRNVIEELQSKKHPTLHLVLIRRYELLETCKPTSADSKEIALVKERASLFIEEKVILEDVHYVATFMCPNVRHLKCLSHETRTKVHGIVQKLCDKIKESNPEHNFVDNVPLEKKSRFGEWSEEENVNTCSDEIALYLAIGKSDGDDPSDLLKWWKSRFCTFPILAKVAKQVLCIPATSASAERNFSRAGLLLTQKRTALSAENVNDLLVIHNNFKDGDVDKIRAV